MAKKLVSYVPCFEGCVPGRVHGCVCRFDVTYVSGVVRSYFGRVSSISVLMRALRARMVSDSSIFDVCVFDPSGHLACEVGWHYRA